MMTMKEVRDKYPQYNDLSDEQLAKALHGKFYSDMPFDEFAGKIGFATELSEANKAQSAAQMSHPYTPTKPKDMPFDEFAGKVGLQPLQAEASKGASGQWGGASGTWEEEKPSGFVRGFAKDPILGLQQLAAETETADLLAPEWAKRKRAEIQESEKTYQSQRGDKGIDWPRLAGQVVNPVNLGIAALTKTPPGMSLPGRMAMGAVGGSAIGATSPMYGDASRAKQGLTGGAAGAIAAPISGALSRVVSPKVDPNLKLLRESGVTPTVGQSFGGAIQRAEDKLMSVPLLGDVIGGARSKGMDQFQRAAYNRALAPIGQQAGEDIGFAGMQKVHNALSQAYDDVLTKLNFKPDSQFVTDSANLRAALAPLGKHQNLYDNVLNDISAMSTKQGNMSGETFKRVEEKLGKEIKALVSDGGYEKGKIAEALMQYRDLLRQGLERSNPMYAPRLQAINEGWANYAILRRAASGPQAAQSGSFTPSQLMQGVQESAKRSGQATGRGKLSEGRALMQDLASAGYNVLPSKYPDSGTAGRAILGVGALGGAGYISPAVAGAVGASALPYLPGVRNVFDLLLNARPAGAGLLGESIRSHPALLSPAAIYGLQ